MLNENIMKEIARLQTNHGVNPAEFIKKYTITDPMIKTDLEYIALSNGGRIPEHAINRHRLTPRHVQITFNGAYRVDLVPQGD